MHESRHAKSGHFLSYLWKYFSCELRYVPLDWSRLSLKLHACLTTYTIVTTVVRCQCNQGLWTIEMHAVPVIFEKKRSSLCILKSTFIKLSMSEKQKMVCFSFSPIAHLRRSFCIRDEIVQLVQGKCGKTHITLNISVCCFRTSCCSSLTFSSFCRKMACWWSIDFAFLRDEPRCGTWSVHCATCRLRIHRVYAHLERPQYIYFLHIHWAVLYSNRLHRQLWQQMHHIFMIVRFPVQIDCAKLHFCMQKMANVSLKHNLREIDSI